MRLSFLKLSLISVALTIGLSGMADAIGELPVTNVNGRLMHYYKVQSKETIYGLCHRFGITSERLIELNPDVADGLRTDMTLYFPADGNLSTTPSRAIVHKVEKKETIYGLSKRYGVTPELIIAQNPAAADGLRAGMTITITPDDCEQPSADLAPKAPVVKVNPDGNTHHVQPGETFYSIARAYGVTLSQLEDANPDVGFLKAGDVLNIPRGATMARTEPQIPAQPQPEPEMPDDTLNVAPGETGPIQLFPVTQHPVRIAVMLPFMLNEKKMDKAAQRATEFYKGFIVGVDSLKNATGPIAVYAYDTKGSADTIKTILNRPEMKSLQAIVAPDSEADFAEIAAWGRDNNVSIFNAFVVKDTLQLSNPRVLQGNIPTPDMYRTVIDAVMRNYPSANIVILSRKSGPNDKHEFVNELVSRLVAEGKTPLYVNFTDRLKESDLAGLPKESPLLFVPVTGRQAELNKMLPALVALKEKALTGDDVQLLGYPEWITFRGETLSQMQKLDATVYSRFYLDEEDSATKALENKFRKWYGSAMDSGVPRQSVRGFDAAMYLIPALRANGGDFSRPTTIYMGVQNGYNFVEAAPGAGYVNNVVYFITFHPGGTVNKVLL